MPREKISPTLAGPPLAVVPLPPLTPAERNFAAVLGRLLAERWAIAATLSSSELPSTTAGLVVQPLAKP
jgi:hypothetical protein